MSSKYRALAVLLSVVVVNSMAVVKGASPVPAVLDFKMDRLDGTPTELKQYQGRVVLIVNVASECGLTPQYKGLQALHDKYGSQGLSVLGFPANEFGAQEPGSNAEISAFCQKNYGVKFDMFSKIVVRGDGQAPLYKFLTSRETNGTLAGPITWNFEKFLVGRNGTVVARFKPNVAPDDAELVAAIERELALKP